MSKGKLNNWKKYLFFSFLLMLSIFLMLNFKHKKTLMTLYGDNKNKILAYIKNLNPIFAKTNITNEDIFNFAFYKTLPLNKEQNKVLFVDNINNQDVIEIKTLPLVKTENLNSFLKFVSNNEKDKSKIDSVLNYYKNNIYQCIFFDDNNYAINPNVILLRENLITDLLKISREINNEKIKELFAYDLNNLKKINYEKSLNNNMNFLLVTNDTVFETKLLFDKKKLENRIIEIQHQTNNIDDEINKPILKLKIDLEKHFNSKKNIEFKKDSTRIKILFNQLSRNINDSIREINNRNILRNIRLLEKNNFSKQLNKNHIVIFSDPTEITKEALAFVNGLKISNAVNKALKSDSLLSFKDSLRIKKMKEEIRNANKELKKYNLDTILIK